LPSELGLTASVKPRTDHRKPGLVVYAEVFGDTRVSASHCYNSRNSTAGMKGTRTQWPDISTKVRAEEKAESTAGLSLLDPRRNTP
jgi:hypothetical protein